MKFSNREVFLKKSVEALSEIYDMLSGSPSLSLDELDPGKTAFVIVDMVNGFAREGALKSPRVEELIPGIAKLSRSCDRRGIVKLAFADSHTKASPEFDAYPSHCIKGTSESEVVDEIKEAGGYLLIPKNSTNGFLEAAFQEWLNANRSIETFLVTGDCTDICIQQFSTTLKTWFNMQDKKSRIIVPINAVGTYDLGSHSADLMEVMALYNMVINGVEVVSGIK